MSAPIKPATDLYGRTLYGDWVHRDFYPLRWLPAPIAIGVAYPYLPSIVTMIAVLIYAGLLLRNQIILMPRDTVPPHLRKTKPKSAIGEDASPPCDASRAPRSTR